MSMFITRLDGKPVNISLLQTVYIDTEDNTKVIWLFRNGEKYEEKLDTEEEATSRYEDVVSNLTKSEGGGDK